MGVTAVKQGPAFPEETALTIDCSRRWCGSIRAGNKKGELAAPHVKRDCARSLQ